MELKTIKLIDADARTIGNAEQWIHSKDTNGEFVNSIQYLSYHQGDRFQDDSIIIIDKGSETIKGVMMAVAATTAKKKRMISHPGTTFAGPIIDYHMDLASAIEVLKCMLGYYEKKYDAVEIRLRPSIYDKQPMEFLQYYLKNNGYTFDMMALANIIDIRLAENEQDLLYLYNAKRRNQVKKVIKDSHYVLKKQENIDKIIWENINQNLKDKFQSKTTHTYEEVCKIRALFPDCVVPYLVERDNQEYGAFALVYKYKNVFHTQYLDLNYKYSSEYPHLYLIHNLIMKAKEEGYKYFSFGASTEDRGKYLNEGLFHYKAGYGGGSIILPVYIWQKNGVHENLKADGEG